MTKAFKALRLISPFVILLGLIALNVTAAQAEEGAYWLVNGAKIPFGLFPILKGATETEEVFLTKVGLSKVEILCSESKLVGAKLELEGNLTGKVHRQGCITKLNGSEAAACKPKSPGASLGLIETNALKGSIVLRSLKNEKGEEIGKDELLEVKPAAGETFATLELGASCAIGNKTEIKGTLFVKDCKGQMLVDKVEHLIEEDSSSSLFVFSSQMTIDGSELWSLTSPHQGMTFAGHAG